ncbi:MAG: gliding motility protein GldL [Bacteroidales bacterium]|nr:gliding motility protein GldL [Bacteroidales bacterium]
MAFYESRGYKVFMARLYGWGASVVILGALFKIQHYPGAGAMLCLGLGTEAVIFFFSGFEPPHTEYDWSLVYPEFAGLQDPEKKKKGTLTQQLDKMLEESKVGPELISSLGRGLKNLSENTAKLTDITQVSVASGEYASKIKNATKSAEELAQAFTQSSESMRKDASVRNELAATMGGVKESATILANSYKQASEIMKGDVSANEEYLQSIKSASKSAQNLVSNYEKSSEMLIKSAQSLDFSKINGQEFVNQMQGMSKNLSSLNSAYELQLKEMSSQSNASASLNQGISEFINYLKNSADDTKKLNDAVAQLTSNISALNNVYGNMLSAMNVNR